MNKRYILSALLVAALAVACDTKSDDPVPTVPETQPTEPVPSDSIPVVPTPTDSIPTDQTPEVPEPSQPVIEPELEVLTQNAMVSANETAFQIHVLANGVDPTFDCDVDWITVQVAPQTRSSEIPNPIPTGSDGYNASIDNGYYPEPTPAGGHVSANIAPDIVDVAIIAPDIVDDVAIESESATIIVYNIVVEANTTPNERVGTVTFSAEGVESVTFMVAQEGARIITPADDSISSSIGSMTGTDFILGPIPMEVMGKLTYSITCTKRDYNQGTWTISKSDLCSKFGITEADFDARKGETIVCLPMNKDWSEGENTAAGVYGAWFGSSGTVGWGSSSIAYLEGSDMLSFGYGMHPDNRSSSCVCRLQYQDKENETAVNVEVTVSLQQ